jgi:hypothetical membrane protein
MAVHELVSMATFLSGGLAAILTARLSSRVLRPVHVALGTVVLTFLLGAIFLAGLPVFDRLGEGGVERWIVYPVILWTVVLGAGLASSRPAPATSHD